MFGGRVHGPLARPQRHSTAPRPTRTCRPAHRHVLVPEQGFADDGVHAAVVDRRSLQSGGRRRRRLVVVLRRAVVSAGSGGSGGGGGSGESGEVDQRGAYALSRLSGEDPRDVVKTAAGRRRAGRRQVEVRCAAARRGGRELDRVGRVAVVPLGDEDWTDNIIQITDLRRFGLHELRSTSSFKRTCSLKEHQTFTRYIEPTFDALVLGLEVGDEVLVTRRRFGERIVEDSHRTRPPTGTLLIHDVDDVVGASDVAEVLADATIDSHATVLRPRNDDHLIPGTLDAEELRVADGHVRQICDVISDSAPVRYVTSSDVKLMLAVTSSVVMFILCAE